jgi:hypothetical protein
MAQAFFVGGLAVQLTRRRRLWIDSEVQGALLFRTVLYWFFLLAATSLIMLCVSAVREPGATLAEYYQRFLTRHGIVAFATLILLPFVLYDVLATSNRFAGPLYRMRQAMRDLASGMRVEPIQFREKDFWRDTADEFNALAAYVEELKQRAGAETRDGGEPRELQAIHSE